MPAPEFTLRAPLHQDVLPYAGFLADPEVSVGLEDQCQRPVPLAAAEAYLLGGIWCPFAIDCEGVFAGIAGLADPVPERGTARFFIVLGARHLWGRGLGTVVAGRVVAHGFENLGLRKIVSDYLDFNQAARTVHARAGFVEEGRLRQDAWRRGRWVDRVLVSILREEYAVRAGNPDG